MAELATVISSAPVAHSSIDFTYGTNGWKDWNNYYFRNAYTLAMTSVGSGGLPPITSGQDWPRG